MTKKVLELKSKRSRATKFTLDSVIYLCLHFTKYNEEAKLTNELVNGHVSCKKSQPRTRGALGKGLTLDKQTGKTNENEWTRAIFVFAKGSPI